MMSVFGIRLNIFDGDDLVNFFWGDPQPKLFLNMDDAVKAMATLDVLSLLDRDDLSVKNTTDVGYGFISRSVTFGDKFGFIDTRVVGMLAR